MPLKSGHNDVALPEEEKKHFSNFEFVRNSEVSLIRLQPDGWLFTNSFLKLADKFYEFQFRPNDVVIMTYPKCGTTWTQEIVWTMFHNPNLDNPEAEIPIMIRSPFMEADFFLDNLPKENQATSSGLLDFFNERYPEREARDGVFLQLAELAQEPRVIKTHLPFPLLNPSLLDTCKVIYVCRNPKDVAVSYYHHHRLFKAQGYNGDLEEFVDLFINDRLIYGPFWFHLKQAFEKRDHPNLLFCYYESMKENPAREIRRMHQFLGLDLSEDQIQNVTNYTSFSAMKKRDNALVRPDNEEDRKMFMNTNVIQDFGGFFRKGETGDWKSKLSLNQAQKIDDWTRKNSKEFDANFPYSLH